MLPIDRFNAGADHRLAGIPPARGADLAQAKGKEKCR